MPKLEMRAFVLFARKARTAPDFSLNDLPGSGGRLDLVARCITQALWLSHKLRDDASFFAVLNGPPSPPITIAFYASLLQHVSPDERNLASWIKIALEKLEQNPKVKEWIKVQRGIAVMRCGIEELVSDLHSSGFSIYILHERGKDITELEFDFNSCFVLGDHLGLPKKIENFIARKCGAIKVSLGPTSYLASSCIAVVNYLLDRGARSAQSIR